ncbi:putative signal transducing protein [Alienimonas chondri]|nr:DUF2007 domain-containing protein [Alienimonas chondri]
MNTSPPPAPEWNPSDDEAIVEVASCADDAEASALATALSEAGVPCRVVQGGSGVGGGGISLGPTTEPKLWVREHDAAAAGKLIAEMRAEIEAAHDRPGYEEE